MRPWRVAPTAIVIWQSVVGRAEIGGSDENGGAAGVAPLPFVRTLDLEARPAAEPFVEQRRAEGGGVYSIALAVQVSISTSTT